MVGAGWLCLRAGQGPLCPCPSAVDRAEGSWLHLYRGTTKTTQSRHPVWNINIYVTFQEADELSFLLKNDPRQTKCNHLARCSPLPTAPPQPCLCISKKMPISAFLCVTDTVNSSGVWYMNQLLCSTPRSLACLWGQLRFQIVWIMRTASRSTFTFSAQLLEFVLCVAREGSSHSSARLQLRRGDCPEPSAGEVLALSAEKIC